MAVWSRMQSSTGSRAAAVVVVDAAH
ncbi:hypothetical protein CCACVL1_15457 [Corchorus capsularis]|uniref:Uncharacterized protein n=1 Tax=Corchorus capsularis TaxID=210143 RepID=A0A1R3I2D0_COCAP|nr:hypothetical protein CCACVL1_15457 [Corchorus capsularis]